MIPTEHEQRHPLQFQHVIFDLDSLLVTIEGIDELAEMNHVSHRVKPLTAAAMNGDRSYEEIFRERLDIIQPTKKQVTLLGQRYKETLTKGARQLVAEVQRRNAHTYIISGGFNPAVNEIAEFLRIPANNVFANSLRFTTDGYYNGIDTSDPTVPLWTNIGKEIVIRSLMDQYPGQFAFISDSDLNAGKLVHRYICFTGVAYRSNVVAQARYIVDSKNLYDAMKYLE